jgi:hypothetical protein
MKGMKEMFYKGIFHKTLRSKEEIEKMGKRKILKSRRIKFALEYFRHNFSEIEEDNRLFNPSFNIRSSSGTFHIQFYASRLHCYFYHPIKGGQTCYFHFQYDFETEAFYFKDALYKTFNPNHLDYFLCSIKQKIGNKLRIESIVSPGVKLTQPYPYPYAYAYSQKKGKA